MPKTKTPLGRCDKCHHPHSVVSQLHKEKGYTLWFCKNKGCGNRWTIPYPLIIHNSDGDMVVNITKLGHKVITLTGKTAKPSNPVPYLICGMNYEEAEKYCEYVSQSCDGTTGYCAKDEVEGA
jgi:hypothetical protein